MTADQPSSFRSPADAVRASFQAYRDGDRATAESLYADDFSFTSPQDDHIDVTTFFERCFPTADHFRSQEIVSLVEAAENAVFLMYEYELQTGEHFRNTEFIRTRDGKLVETQVFFGGRVG